MVDRAGRACLVGGQFSYVKPAQPRNERRAMTNHSPHAGSDSHSSHPHGSSKGSAPRCPFHAARCVPVAISAELKERTRDQHVKAEHHPLQQQAVRGTIDRRLYAALVAQLRHLHQALETHLDRLVIADERVARVFAPHCRRLHLCDADLALLDPSGQVHAPLAASRRTAEWIAELAGTTPIALLGVLYVVEGSTNGGKFIAPILRRAWGLAEGEGLQSLDPHGAQTHALWGNFRTAIDGLELSGFEREAIVSVAGETFDRIGQAMDDVMETYAVAQPA